MRARSLFRRLCSWRGLLILSFVCLGIGFGAPNAWAWYHLRAGRADLERFHAEDARAHLTKCLAIWPENSQVLLLVSRAARQCGEFEEAAGQLRNCQRLTEGTSDDIALEWALLQASAGNTSEPKLEEYLQRRMEHDPKLSPLVWEALGEGYIRLYRILDALYYLDHWLQLDPDNLRALELRGLAYQNGKSAGKGAQDFRRVLEKDPTREATRWRLVLCLLDMGSYDEAYTHLEQIARQKPHDADVQVRLARCHNMLGRGEQARQIIDEILRNNAEHSLALRTRGQFALADQQSPKAEEFLRRAIAVSPNDYQSQWLLFQSLQQQNKLEESKAQLVKVEEIKERSERLGDLRSRRLSEKPLDPALHYEMGILLMRQGQEEIGARWLESALNLDPAHGPAHLALADYYERRGDTKRAAEHRSQVHGSSANQ